MTRASFRNRKISQFHRSTTSTSLLSSTRKSLAIWITRHLLCSTSPSWKLRCEKQEILKKLWTFRREARRASGGLRSLCRIEINDTAHDLDRGGASLGTSTPQLSSKYSRRRFTSTTWTPVSPRNHTNQNCIAPLLSHYLASHLLFCNILSNNQGKTAQGLSSTLGASSKLRTSSLLLPTSSRTRQKNRASLKSASPSTARMLKMSLFWTKE